MKGPITPFKKGPAQKVFLVTWVNPNPPIKPKFWFIRRAFLKSPCSASNPKLASPIKPGKDTSLYPLLNPNCPPKLNPPP